MASPNILAAIGAALQQGSQTFGRLDYDEQERKRQDEARQAQLEQQRVQNALAARRMEQDEEQLSMQREDRTYRRIQDALEGAGPHGAVNQETYDLATPEQRNRLDVSDVGDAFATPGAGMGIGGIGLATSKQISRKPTFKEQGEIADRDREQEERTRAQGFRDHLTTPEHAAEDFDTQTRENFSHGINNMPLSSAEFDRRNKVEHDQRMAQIKAQTAWHGQVAGNKPKAVDPMLSKWLSTKAQVSDDLRATARGAIEAASSFEEAMDIMQKIDAEAERRTNEMLGPRPQTGGDATPTPSGPSAGLDPVDAFLQANPNVTVEQVRTDANIPLEAKKAILAKLMSKGPPAPPGNLRVSRAVQPQAPMLQPESSQHPPVRDMVMKLLESIKPVDRPMRDTSRPPVKVYNPHTGRVE